MTTQQGADEMAAFAIGALFLVAVTVWPVFDPDRPWPLGIHVGIAGFVLAWSFYSGIAAFFCPRCAGRRDTAFGTCRACGK